jgi:hypothetical protein
MSRRFKPHKPQQARPNNANALDESETTPDWTHECEVCGETPIVPFTGLCGPCTFGEAETAGGNW